MIRLFDLVSSTLGLVVLSPLFLFVAGAIRFGDGGPVFFRQVRVGRDGRPFSMLKFRTMTLAAESNGLPLTVGQDARITKVGRWLRRWKIDELPQLVNVVRGEMGLVGPRPEVPRYVELYTEEQARVLRLRPGITDAASITYRAENDVLRRCEDPESFYIQNIMPNKIRINLQYAAHATVWGNFKIILATLGCLPPPLPVRQGGDLRAFDRVPLGASVQVTSGDLPLFEVQPISISIGGMLLKPQPNLAVGSVCFLIVTPEDRPQDRFVAEGMVIRTDEVGTAIRFTRPLEERALEAKGIRVLSERGR